MAKTNLRDLSFLSPHILAPTLLLAGCLANPSATNQNPPNVPKISEDLTEQPKKKRITLESHPSLDFEEVYDSKHSFSADFPRLNPGNSRFSCLAPTSGWFIRLRNLTSKDIARIGEDALSRLLNPALPKTEEDKALAVLEFLDMYGLELIHRVLLSDPPPNSPLRPRLLKALRILFRDDELDLGAAQEALPLILERKSPLHKRLWIIEKALKEEWSSASGWCHFLHYIGNVGQPTDDSPLKERCAFWASFLHQNWQNMYLEEGSDSLKLN